jgi:hypothetical protein
MITKVARINFPMDDDLHRRAKKAAIDMGIPLRKFIALAVEKQVEQVERGEAVPEARDEPQA